MYEQKKDDPLDQSVKQSEGNGEFKDKQISKKFSGPEEDDVPGDFFDDFLKEDFMEGLDIVDEDECSEEKQAENGVEQESSKKRSKNRTKSSKDGKEERSREHSHGSNEKDSEQNKKDKDDTDTRRDPVKTKRDMENYKARCDKDKEKKIITEKLNLVETGLIPPGMETEIDLEEIKKEKQLAKKPIRDLRDRISARPTKRSKSPFRPRRSSAERRPSPKRRRSRSPRPIRNFVRKSPLRISPIRRDSPRIVSTFRKISPRRFEARRSRSPNPLYRQKRRRYSPEIGRYRNRSNSGESDREKWLKRRMRSRSRSPRKKREEKKSFLQEIAEKLNETRPPMMAPQMTMMPQPSMMNQVPNQMVAQPEMYFMQVPQQVMQSPMPVPAPIPVPPVPHPDFSQMSQPTQPPPYDPYDQSFFIGSQTDMSPFLNAPNPNPAPQTDLNPVSVEAQAGALPARRNRRKNRSNKKLLQIKEKFGNINIDNSEDISKLFQDEKISLSEFLAITAKPEVTSTSPSRLQEKIKVITRCQEAIRILSNGDQKYEGKLIIKEDSAHKTVPNESNKSPLLKPSLVYRFTAPPNKKAPEVIFETVVKELLAALGIAPNAEEKIEGPPMVEAFPSKNAVLPPPPPQISHFKQKQISLQQNVPKLVANKPHLPIASVPDKLNKFVQTTVFKCESCEKRKKILYKSASVQCGGDSTTFSVCTQVTEEDFQSKAPKSLASLTPAQLLGKTKADYESHGVSKYGRSVKDDFDVDGFNRYNQLRDVRPSGSYGLSVDPYDSFNPREEVRLFYDNPVRVPFQGGGRERTYLPGPSRNADPRLNNYNNYY